MYRVIHALRIREFSLRVAVISGRSFSSGILRCAFNPCSVHFCTKPRLTLPSRQGCGRLGPGILRKKSGKVAGIGTSVSARHNSCSCLGRQGVEVRPKPGRSSFCRAEITMPSAKIRFLFEFQGLPPYTQEQCPAPITPRCWQWR
jgi:hypothetical protein